METLNHVGPAEWIALAASLAALAGTWAWSRRVTRRMHLDLCLRGFTGADAAREILSEAGAEEVKVVTADRASRDRYDSAARKLELSLSTSTGRDLAALCAAAHLAGHAIQRPRRGPLQVLRDGALPSIEVTIGGVVLTFLIGLAFDWALPVRAAMLIAAARVVLGAILLPLELDASRCALRGLLGGSLLVDLDERERVRELLYATTLRGAGGCRGAGRFTIRRRTP